MTNHRLVAVQPGNLQGLIATRKKSHVSATTPQVFTVFRMDSMCTAALIIDAQIIVLHVLTPCNVKRPVGWIPAGIGQPCPPWLQVAGRRLAIGPHSRVPHLGYFCTKAYWFSFSPVTTAFSDSFYGKIFQNSQPANFG